MTWGEIVSSFLCLFFHVGLMLINYALATIWLGGATLFSRSPQSKEEVFVNGS